MADKVFASRRALLVVRAQLVTAAVLRTSWDIIYQNILKYIKKFQIILKCITICQFQNISQHVNICTLDLLWHIGSFWPKGWYGPGTMLLQAEGSATCMCVLLRIRYNFSFWKIRYFAQILKHRFCFRIFTSSLHLLWLLQGICWHSPFFVQTSPPLHSWWILGWTKWSSWS